MTVSTNFPPNFNTVPYKGWYRLRVCNFRALPCLRPAVRGPSFIEPGDVAAARQHCGRHPDSDRQDCGQGGEEGGLLSSLQGFLV